MANIGSIIEEAIERVHYAMKLFIKVMPNFKYYVCISYGLSNQFYGRESYKLTGTKQGNKFSWDMYRDVSYLIIKQIEKENLYINIDSSALYNVQQYISVSFVNSTDLVTNGLSANLKM